MRQEEERHGKQGRVNRYESRQSFQVDFISARLGHLVGRWRSPDTGGRSQEDGELIG
jgi:hypothetical protein